MNLLIGGGSSVGKTVAAQALAAGLGLTHVELDSLIEGSEYPGLRFDGHDPTVWDHHPLQLKELLIGKGHAVEPYLPRWLGLHSSDARGVLLEGEGIHPASHAELVDLPGLRLLFVVELDPDVLRATLQQASESYRSLTDTRQDVVVETNRLYNEWIAEEANLHSLPWIDSQPWPSLPARLLRAL